MSMSDFWKEMYEKNFQSEMALRKAKTEMECRLIRCEGQRMSMMFALETSAELLKTRCPEFAQHLLAALQQWKDRYEGQPIEKTLGEIASLVPAVPGHSGPEASPQAETPVGVPQGSIEWEGMSFPARE